MQSSDSSNWIRSLITDFVLNSPENSLFNPENDRAYDAPLVGFSSGADPLYQFFQQDIGSFFLTPPEWFANMLPEVVVQPSDLTIISWVLPSTEAAKASSRNQIEFPGEKWARGRLFGEKLNGLLRSYVVATLSQAGFPALTPLHSPIFNRREKSEKYGFSGTWSERHAAYVSGLGTFGLCDGLITSAGKAMRCGSVIAKIAVQPTVRPYSNHHEYCLHFSREACGQCIERCPAGAITEQGHDKVKCQEYYQQKASKYAREQYGVDTETCALCQTGVSCESRIPDKKLREAAAALTQPQTR